MVKVWVADISPLFSGEKYDACYAALPDWRKKKADSLKQEQARAQSVGVWTLWMQVCRKEGLPEDVSYNLSHSGNYVMCAYSTRPGARVGCDLEMLGEFREKTARRFFCQEEYAYILKEEREEERRNLFYRFWVLKESFLKATRRGMGLDTRSFQIGWDEDEFPQRWRSAPQIRRLTGTFSLKKYEKTGVKGLLTGV